MKPEAEIRQQVERITFVFDRLRASMPLMLPPADATGLDTLCERLEEIHSVLKWVLEEEQHCKCGCGERITLEEITNKFDLYVTDVIQKGLSRR